VSCLLGIFDLHDGIATIDQLRMRTPDTTWSAPAGPILRQSAST